MPARKITVTNLFKKKPPKKTGSSHMWQKAQSTRKKRKTLRKIFFGLFVFGLVTTLYFMNHFRAIVSNSFNPLPTSITYLTNPNTNYRVNILLITTAARKSMGQLVLASYSQANGTISWLKIPTDVYMDLPGEYGWGDLANAYLLGQSESPQKGSDILVRGVERLLAVPIDGYIAFDQENIDLNQGTLEQIRKSLFGPRFILGSIGTKLWLDHNLHTSLTPLSLLTLSWKTHFVRFDKVSFKDLGSLVVDLKASERNYPVLDTQALDNYLQEEIADPNILADLAKIEVRNTTREPGLGLLAARVINNLGGNVVFTGNSEENLTKSAVLVYGKKDATASRLGQVLGAKVTTKKEDPGVRGDIVIQVGQDFFDKLRLK